MWIRHNSFARGIVLLMLLWLPIKGVLAAAMPFDHPHVEHGAMVMAHCQMEPHAANADTDMLVADMHASHTALPLYSALDSHAGQAFSHSGAHCQGSSLTCHGFCAVFLAVDYALPDAVSHSVLPPAVPVVFRSYIPDFPERPPLV